MDTQLTLRSDRDPNGKTINASLAHTRNRERHADYLRRKAHYLSHRQAPGITLFKVNRLPKPMK